MTTPTHITYKTAKMLKEFLGESAPEPMNGKCYGHDGKIFHTLAGYPHTLFPTYQLHDLLSKPFCEAMIKAGKEKQGISEDMATDVLADWSTEIGYAYFNGGLPAVEKALMEMMEAK